ncbi:MAG: hypothetical protein AB1592_15365 [Pseudomonadota bacterium]
MITQPCMAASGGATPHWLDLLMVSQGPRPLPMTLSRATASAGPAEARAKRGSTLAVRLLVAAGSALFLMLLAAAGMLWVKNGTSVFFETLSAGLAACF